MSVSYGLICGAKRCANNFNSQCVKEAKKVNSDILTLNYEGQCVNYMVRRSLDERLDNYE